MALIVPFARSPASPRGKPQPQGRGVAPTSPVEPTYALMAAAALHAEGKINLNGPDGASTDQT